MLFFLNICTFIAGQQCPYAKLWIEHGPENAMEMIEKKYGRSIHDSRKLLETSFNVPENNPPICEIAPGPIGSAHQAAYSSGYKTDCPDTPAIRSPYMLPLRWTALIEQTALPVGNRNLSRSFGGGPDQKFIRTQVYYDLSKNMKRADSLFNGTVTNTMIHRNNEMFFISYKDGMPSNCTGIDLGLVGNMRPDWYLDARGDQTSSQFLGNQHVYHNGKPTLVKQWRKKDFADMYFVVSILAESGGDGIHWPMFFNVPGEGFGDDFLSQYLNHRILNESEINTLFYLDKTLHCFIPPRRNRTGDFNQEHVPSHLNVEEAGWVKNVWTGSPDGPAKPPVLDCRMEKDKSDTGKSSLWDSLETKKLGGKGSMQYCLDSNSNLNLHVTYSSDSEAWAAIGFRDSLTCQMIPAEIVAAVFTGEAYNVRYGDLSPQIKNFAFQDSNNTFFNSLKTNMNGYSETKVTYSDGSIQMEISRHIKDISQINMIWAVGRQPSMSYHESRGCVILTNISSCPGSATLKKKLELKSNPATLIWWGVVLIAITSAILGGFIVFCFCVRMRASRHEALQTLPVSEPQK